MKYIKIIYPLRLIQLIFILCVISIIFNNDILRIFLVGGITGMTLSFLFHHYYSQRNK